MASNSQFKLSIQVSKEEFLLLQKQARISGVELDVWIKQKLKSPTRIKTKSTNDDSQLVLFNRGGMP